MVWWAGGLVDRWSDGPLGRWTGGPMAWCWWTGGPLGHQATAYAPPPQNNRTAKIHLLLLIDDCPGGGGVKLKRDGFGSPVVSRPGCPLETRTTPLGLHVHPQWGCPGMLAPGNTMMAVLYQRSTTSSPILFGNSVSTFARYIKGFIPPSTLRCSYDGPGPTDPR